VGLPLRRHGTQRRNRESQLARARGESLTASSKTTRAESTPPAHVVPVCSASWSRSVEGDVDEVWTRLAMLKTVSNNSKGQSLHLGLSLRRRSAVSQDAGQFRHFGQPPPVLFALDLDPEPHEPILPPACSMSVEPRDQLRAARNDDARTQCEAWCVASFAARQLHLVVRRRWFASCHSGRLVARVRNQRICPLWLIS